MALALFAMHDSCRKFPTSSLATPTSTTLEFTEQNQRRSHSQPPLRAAAVTMPSFRDFSSNTLNSLSRTKKNASTISLHDIGEPYDPRHLLSGSPLSILRTPSPDGNPRDEDGRISPKILVAGGDHPGLTTVTGAEQQPITYHELEGDTPAWSAYQGDCSPDMGPSTRESPLGSNPVDPVVNTESDVHPLASLTATSSSQREQQDLWNSTRTGTHSHNTSPEAGVVTTGTSNSDPLASLTATSSSQRTEQDPRNSTRTGTRSNNTSPEAGVVPTGTSHSDTQRKIDPLAERTRIHRERSYTTLDTPRSATPSTRGIPPLPTPPAKWANDEHYNRTNIAPRSDNTLTAVTSTPTRSARKQRSDNNLAVTDGETQEVTVSTLQDSRTAKTFAEQSNRVDSQPRLRSLPNGSSTDIRVAEGGLIKRKPVASGASPTVPQKNAARYVRTPGGTRAAHTIVGQAGPHDRVAAAPPLPATWGTMYDRALCIMEVWGWNYGAIIRELRLGLGDDVTLTGAMLDQRIRQLDGDLRCTYFQKG